MKAEMSYSAPQQLLHFPVLNTIMFPSVDGKFVCIKYKHLQAKELLQFNDCYCHFNNLDRYTYLHGLGL